MCDLGADSALVSLTHTDAHACAVVVLESSKTEPRPPESDKRVATTGVHNG
jgi:hypothetical protein